MERTPRPTCSTCWFYSTPGPPVSGDGTCHLEPPKMEYGADNRLASAFPQVDPTDWCGHHRPESLGPPVVIHSPGGPGLNPYPLSYSSATVGGSATGGLGVDPGLTPGTPDTAPVTSPPAGRPPEHWGDDRPFARRGPFGR